MSQLISLLLATRPKTLPAIIIPIWAASLIVSRYAEHYPELGFQLDWWLVLCTALSALAIQIACNLFNDALDAQKKADTPKRQGPRRLTATGALSATAVKGAAALFLLLSCLAALPLIHAAGWVVLAIGIPSLFLAYGYTGGPFPLAYRGMGELFVLLFFGFIAVLGTLYIQLGWQGHYAMIYGAGIILGVQCGLLCCLLLEINNIRDRAEDASTGKRTLAVRIGEARARGLAVAFLLAPYLTLKQTAFFLPGTSWGLIWCAPVLLAGYLIVKITRTPANKKMNPLLGLASLHMILFLTALTWN